MLEISLLQTKKNTAVAEAYGNKFLVPLDFEMLDSSVPCYQAGLGNRLCYEITFNDYNRVIKSAVASPDDKYVISNISLEYKIVSNSTLARSIKTEYDEMILLYDRILRHGQIPVNKSDTTWNWSFNMPCKSLKGILVLFEQEKSYAQDTGKFYNPKIQKVSVIIEGKPNQLYTQGMRSFEQYDENCKYFTEGSQKDKAGRSGPTTPTLVGPKFYHLRSKSYVFKILVGPTIVWSRFSSSGRTNLGLLLPPLKDNNVIEVQKHSQLHNVNVGEYLTDKYALWLDFRTIDKNFLH